MCFSMMFLDEMIINGSKTSELARLYFVSLDSAPILSPVKTLKIPLSVDERVAITLWRLNTTIEYQSLGHLFGVRLCTVHEVCTTGVDVLSQGDWRKYSEGS